MFHSADLENTVNRIGRIAGCPAENLAADNNILRVSASSFKLEDRNVFLLFHPTTSWVLRQRETFLEPSNEFWVWTHFYENVPGPVLAYAVRLKGIQNGKLSGDLYPLDFEAYTKRLQQLTCPIDKLTLLFRDGSTSTVSYAEYGELLPSLENAHGPLQLVKELPESEQELMMILRRERSKWSFRAKHTDLESHIRGLEMMYAKTAGHQKKRKSQER